MPSDSSAVVHPSSGKSPVVTRDGALQILRRAAITVAWKEDDFDLAAKGWVKSRFTAEKMVAYLNAKCADPRAAVALYDAGITPEEARTLRAETKHYGWNTVAFHVSAAAGHGQIVLAAATAAAVKLKENWQKLEELLPTKSEGGFLALCEAWTKHEIGPSAATAWVAADCRSPHAARQMRDEGITPQEAGQLTLEGTWPDRRMTIGAKVSFGVLSLDDAYMLVRDQRRLTEALRALPLPPEAEEVVPADDREPAVRARAWLEKDFPVEEAIRWEAEAGCFDPQVAVLLARRGVTPAEASFRNTQTSAGIPPVEERIGRKCALMVLSVLEAVKTVEMRRGVPAYVSEEPPPTAAATDDPLLP